MWHFAYNLRIRELETERSLRFPATKLEWLFLVVNLTTCGMNYNPELEGSPMIDPNLEDEKYKVSGLDLDMEILKP